MAAIGNSRGEISFLARNPRRGTILRGTGGVRKLRWSRPGAGKSGGYWAIYFFHDEEAPIYAILVYGKNRQADLTADQARSAAKLVDELKRAIRGSRSGEAGAP